MDGEQVGEFVDDFGEELAEEVMFEEVEETKSYCQPVKIRLVVDSEGATAGARVDSNLLGGERARMTDLRDVKPMWRRLDDLVIVG